MNASKERDWSAIAVEAVGDIAPCTSDDLLQWMGVVGCDAAGHLPSGWEGSANEGVLRARSEGSITQDQLRRWELTETGEKIMRDSIGS